jgi:hypothetical protein
MTVLTLGWTLVTMEKLKPKAHSAETYCILGIRSVA